MIAVSLRDRALRLRHDLGGEWFLDPLALATIVPTATVASVATHAQPTFASIAGWTIANIIAFVVCAAIAYGLARATHRRRQDAPLPILATILAGGLLGGVKALGTDWAGAALRLTSASVASVEGRVVQVVVVGIITVPVFILMRATLARHRIEHRLLVAETFTGLLAPAPGAAIDSTVDHAGPNGRRSSRTSGEGEARARQEAAAVLRELRHALTQVPPAAASELLTGAVEDRLRPLTHRLWSNTRAPSSDLTISGLIGTMLRRPMYPVVVPTLVHGVVVTLFALDLVAPPRALATGAAAAGSLAALLFLARISRPPVERPVAGVLHLALVLATASAGALMVRALLAPEFQLSAPAIVALMVTWVIPLILTSGIVATAARDRDAIRAQLVAALGPDWYAHLMRTHVDAAAARDIADRLHGDLQGELLAAAARIRSLKQNEVAIRQELARVSCLIEAAMNENVTIDRSPLEERLADLRARWAGLLDIHLEVSIDEPLDGRSEDLIIGIVSEALTNARRHGFARKAIVRIMWDSAGVTDARVIIDDDGLGPRKGAAGIGSAHLDAVAPGRWSRSRRTDGGTRLDVTLAGPSRARAGAT